MRKKLTILTFFIALCTLGFGQGMHWTQIHEMDNSMSLAAVVKIGGELQASSDIELAAFKGDVCRGTVKLTHVQMPNHNIDGYFAYLSIDGAVGENFTFKLYDHNASEEYSLSNTVLEFNPDNSTSPFNPFEVEFIGGAGTSQAPYLIGNLDELNTFLNSVNVGNKFKGEFIKLTADIDLAAATRSAVTNWEPIGTSENPFQGTFDGGGNTIKNLNIVETEAKEGKAYIGFFGYAKDATIKNVVFENVNLNIACLDIDHSQGHIGAVAGSLEGTSKIEDVTVKGDITVEATFDANGASRVAVVAGGNSYGNVTMKNVHVIANEGSYLKANNNLGALAGQLQGKNVFENCSSNIDVTGKKFFAGGIIGIAAGDSQFTNCHTTGDVTITAGREGRANDHYRVGGIAGGWADNKDKDCTLTNCTYTGTVSGTNADGSVAKILDYAGYVGRGYTLNNLAGSTVVIDGVDYVQAFDDVHGLYKIDGVLTLNTADHLKNFATKVNGGNLFIGETIKLGDNIDLNNEEWTPIGNNTNQFKGYFDGNNKTIKNLKVSGSNRYVGLFGYIKGQGMSASTTPSVKDLTLENVNVSGDYYVGGLSGQAYTCNITNVTVKGEVSGVRYVGGLVGHVYTYFKDCHFIGDASCSFDALGGIAGAGDCRAYDCSVIGDVTGSNWVGGIVGNGQEGTSAVGCYVKGDVKTSNNYYRGVGGIAGVAGHGYASSEFKNNYFDGEVYLEDVRVPAMIMGLVNANDNASIKATVEGNSWNTDYYDVNTPVYVVAEISSSDASLEDWIDGASEELTKPRNNNLVMLESDIQYVEATDIDDVTIMKFSEVTVDDILPQIEENNQVAYIDSNADGAYNEGETKYTSFADAYTAATNGQTITLLKNITLGEKFVIAKSITLDGNGKTLTYTGTDRAIDVPNDANANLDVTIKNLNVVATTANRGLNYNENGKFNVEGVTVTIGENVDGYAINFPGMADNAQVTIKDSKLTSCNPLNIWGENMVINVYDSEIISVDNSTTYDYAAIQLNNDNYGNVANGTVVNVYGGIITALNDNDEPSNVVANATETGVVNISDETVVTGKVLDYVANIGGVYFGSLQAAVNAIEKYGYNSPIVIMKSFATSETATVKNDLNVTIDLNGKTITVTDETEKNFEVIKNQGTLTIKDSSAEKTGKITVEATVNSGWNRYSAVIANTVGGKLTVDGGTLEHLGGTDMAYGIDNLTNGKGTYAETVINGGTIKSTYRGIRQFLNGTEAQNILTVNGGTIEGANKSIWMQDPNKNANTGTLTVGENATLEGDVYLYVTEGSTEWPVAVSIADGALAEGSEVMTANVPAGYELQQDTDGNYVVNQGVAKIGEVLYATVTEAINAAENGGIVQLLALTIDEYVAPWATDTQHTSEKSITIIGAENFGTTMTGGLYLGYDDSQCREHTIVVKGINFTGKGLKVACQQNVTIEGNTFSNITEGQAIAVVGKNIKSVVKNNVIDGVTTSNPGIELRNTLTATVEGNTISNTGHNALQITSQEDATESAIAVTNNKMSNWGTAQNAQGELEGRAMRISKIVTADVNNNVMINVNAPEEFVKITGHTTAEIDENYWNGANPTSSNTPAYFLAEGVQVHNYYAAYDAETNTLSDLVTIEGAGETLEIFYTAAGEVTEQANAAYSLMFTVTDYANNEVSVKIGSKNPAENKGCDLLIPSSVKFNDQDFAVTSIPVDGFKECKGFDKLVVPGTITSVSNSAFYNCLRLTEVVIEEGVQKLGSSTFYKILDLQTLTLPSTLTRIASLCFNGTHNIETIVCNAQTPPTAFNGSFTEAVYKNALLYVDGKYEDYKAADGWSNFKNILAVGATQTIDKDRYTLIATITDVWNRTCSVQIGTAPTNTKRAELAIPEHVSFSGIEFDITSIPEGGFQDCKYFEGTLTIPAYITSIGGSAFRGCSAVTALVVEEGVTSLGTGDTFRDCLNIATITLPSTLTEIPTRCFHNIQQKLKVVECHALVPPTLASQFTQAVYNGATLYVHDVDAYKGANNWKLFKSIRLIGAVAQNKETEVEYKSIAEAVAAANAGETVQMLQNVDLENTITVAAGKEVILDLNGKTVSYTTKEHKGEAMITNNGNLTITDTSDEETGSLSYAYEGGADSSYGFGNSTIENKGVLTINAGTVENTSAAMSHASYAINTGAGATLNVEGGNIINENGHAVRMVSFGTTLNTVNIEGGYIEGTRALQVQLPGSASAAAPEMELNITGGELKSNDETYNLAIYVYVYSSGQSAEDLTIKIEGGTFNGNVAIYEPSVTMEANSVVVSGGTFNGAYGIYTYGVTEADQAVISIVGGTFATNYSEWWATDDNYVFEQNENGTYSVVEQTIFTQTTQLNAGWNWFSYYVDTDLAALETALGENGVEIKSKADGFRRYDETIGWYGKLNSITSEQMYQVNTNEACSVVLEGELLDNITITLHHGWNYIGYPIGQSTSLQEALDNLTPSTNDQIKSKASGNASYDTDLQMWYGGLKTLVPGEGYMYYNSSENDVTFTYNVSRSNAELKANITTDGNYWIPNAGQYPNNMTMTAMVEVEGGDYEVAAFVNGECRGSARPIYIEAMDAHILFLTIHGEDVEEMTFRYYDLATGEEFDLNDRMNYSNDAIVGTIAEPYIFSRGTTGIGEASLSEVNIYPNPTTTGTEINLQATCDTVEVFNALGVKVAEYHNVDSLDAFETAGIYVIRLTNNGDVKHCRLVVK